MAGYQFRSTGSAFADELAKVASEREAERRRQLLDSITMKRESRLEKADDSEMKYRDENLKSIVAQRTAMEQLNAENLHAKQIEDAGKTFKVGQRLTGDQAKSVPTELRTPEFQASELGEQPQTGFEKFTGTQDQQQQEAALADPSIPDAAKAAIRAGAKPTADLFKPQPRKYHTVGGYLFEELPNGDMKKVAEGREPKSGGGDNKPFVIIRDTAEGPMIVDGRTGNVKGRLGDSKPSEGTIDAITQAQSVLFSIGNLEKNFTPEVIGPLMGRYKTVEQAIAGGDPVFNEVQQAAQQLHNSIVYMRTGKQMNESEAARILAELPSIHNQPDVFIQRLRNAKALVESALHNRAKLGFGRVTSGDVNALTGAEGAASAGGAGGSGVLNYDPTTGRAQ